MKTLSPLTQRAISKYGLRTCLAAFARFEAPPSYASGIDPYRIITTYTRGLNLKTVAQAKAAVNAGREIRQQEAEKKFAIRYDSAGPFLANYDYANGSY